MLDLSSLRPAPGSRREPVRKGRGIGSGLGKTAGRGQKGQKARSGGGVRPGFEGGQMPLVRRMPKRGFRNPFRQEFVVVNVEKLNRFPDGTVVTSELLRKAGLVKKRGPVKILGSGELKRSLTVRVEAVSKGAAAKIEAARGRVEVEATC
ncbi:ribosomal protein L15 [Ammonifex degensii KC4]|uniref:Large ribosomal subunit protein uL15 n=1 Tax=Ammonifex degensii (strain DSM 10501 / KC4) TaxID=429009 RepID=C9R8H1_AMMDK|nr:50S ribosomal protein L15 [Ammonifex degensii]ACX52600.1 ribosomal protein L15 [Ammonifex degensii KC4]